MVFVPLFGVLYLVWCSLGSQLDWDLICRTVRDEVCCGSDRKQEEGPEKVFIFIRLEFHAGRGKGWDGVQTAGWVLITCCCRRLILLFPKGQKNSVAHSIPDSLWSPVRWQLSWPSRGYGAAWDKDKSFTKLVHKWAKHKTNSRSLNFRFATVYCVHFLTERNCEL